MEIEIDVYLLELVVLALFLCLSINGVCFIMWLGKKYPKLIYRED